MLIIMENHSFSQIVSNPDAPYLNQLAQRFGLAANYQAVTHPSLPNYLALTGGSTFGITTDCTGCSVPGSSLADQLEAKGLTWKAYMDGMPSACFSGSTSGNYAKKHNPFLYYDDIAGNATRCSQSDVPLSALNQDLAAGSLPSFSLVVPDQCHDMHSCPVADGDTWMAGFLPSLLSSSAYQSGSTTIYITFDEGTDADNQVATWVIRPSVAPGTRFSAAASHYSLLRTIEDSFGLAPLGQAAGAGDIS